MPDSNALNTDGQSLYPAPHPAVVDQTEANSPALFSAQPMADLLGS
ncbi:MAG: hypothetical protein WCJ14_14625 [Verrucomicrobiota bacterium]